MLRKLSTPLLRLVLGLLIINQILAHGYLKYVRCMTENCCNTRCSQVDHFSKYKLQDNASDDEGEQQQQQKVQQLPLQLGSSTAPAKVSEHYSEINVQNFIS